MPEIRDCTINFSREQCGVNIILDPQQSIGSQTDKSLIIGQVADDATIATCQPVKYSDIDTALLGTGSMIEQQVNAAIEQYPRGEYWILPLPNDGTPGIKTIQVSGVDTATMPGIVYFWVNGNAYSVSFDPAAETNDDIAAKIAAVIDAEDPTVTVTVATDTVTVETLANGEVGGYLDIRSSYSVRPDLAGSTEVTLTVAGNNGTGTPDLSCIESLSDGFSFVINPYTDDDSIASVETYACSQWSGGARTRVYGAFYGTKIEGETFARNLNNAFFSYVGVDGALQPSYLLTSYYGAELYERLKCDSGVVAENLSGIAFTDFLPPEAADRYSTFEIDDLVNAGLGYLAYTSNNTATIGRAVTTFTTRDNGTLDDSLRDVNKPAIMACISQYMQEMITARFSGYAFRADGVVGSSRTKVLTIPALRNYIATLGQELSNRDLIENITGFISSIQIEQDDAGCIAISVDPELVCALCCVTVNLRTQ